MIEYMCQNQVNLTTNKIPLFDLDHKIVTSIKIVCQNQVNKTSNKTLKWHLGTKIMIEYECPGFCPVECNQDQILCRHFDDKGCEQPGWCAPAMCKFEKKLNFVPYF